MRKRSSDDSIWCEHRRNGIAVERGQVRDVRALIAVLGRLLPAPHCLDRGPEAIHLRAGVVVVVLALDGVPGVREDARHRVPVGAVPGRCDRDRPGRVRGDHLDLHPLDRVDEPAAVALARLEHLAERVHVPGRGEPEVDEPRPRDLGPLDELVRRRLLRELLRDLARRALPLRRELERSIRREVAVLRARGPLELDPELGRRAVRAP